jgi:hypothetical protein
MSLQYFLDSIFQGISAFFSTILIRPFTQSSPEIVTKAVDPNSAADFYGLFNAYGPPPNQAEEQKVSQNDPCVP